MRKRTANFMSAGGASPCRIQQPPRAVSTMTSSPERPSKAVQAPAPPDFDTAWPEYRNRCTFALCRHWYTLTRLPASVTPSRTRRAHSILLRLNAAPEFPSELADQIGVSRQIVSNHLACLRGCGLVVAVPEGRRSRYELADPRIGHALNDLMGLVLAVDPNCSCTGTDGTGCGCA